jgi:hypothetical protein
VPPSGHVWTSFTSSGLLEWENATEVNVVPKSNPQLQVSTVRRDFKPSPTKHSINIPTTKRFCVPPEDTELELAAFDAVELNIFAFEWLAFQAFGFRFFFLAIAADPLG